MSQDRLFLMWYDKLDRLGGLSPQEKYTMAAFHAAIGLICPNDYVQKDKVDYARDGAYRKVIGLEQAS